MVRAYISGKMHSDPDFKERFGRAATTLAELGFYPLNPAEFYGADKPEYTKALLYDLWRLLECDVIYMLKGWEGSPGARAEKAFAEAIGICVMYDKGDA